MRLTPLFYLDICYVNISIRKYFLVDKSEVTLGGEEEINFIFISVSKTLADKANVFMYFFSSLV